MGSKITLNDTLKITKEQGFPFDIEKHLENPYKLEDFENKIFEFKNKKGIRIYQVPPVRVFLVEDIDDKWIYWGLCFITELNLDYENEVASGKFRIIKLNTPEEMKQVHDIIDLRPELKYFN